MKSFISKCVTILLVARFLVEPAQAITPQSMWRSPKSGEVFTSQSLMPRVAQISSSQLGPWFAWQVPHLVGVLLLSAVVGVGRSQSTDSAIQRDFDRAYIEFRIETKDRDNQRGAIAKLREVAAFDDLWTQGFASGIVRFVAREDADPEARNEAVLCLIEYKVDPFLVYRELELLIRQVPDTLLDYHDNEKLSAIGNQRTRLENLLAQLSPDVLHQWTEGSGKVLAKAIASRRAHHVWVIRAGLAVLVLLATLLGRLIRKSALSAETHPADRLRKDA